VLEFGCFIPFLQRYTGFHLNRIIVSGDDRVIRQLTSNVRD